MKASSYISNIISESSGSIYIPCWVQPRASLTKIAGIHGEHLKIQLSAPPVDGKANAELCKFFSKKLGVPKSSIDIVSGASSRKKTLRVTGVSKEQFIKATSA